MMIPEPMVKKMIGTTEKIIIARIAPRNSIEITVTCRPYASSDAIRASDGEMHNYSNRGAYIETPHRFNPGTILIVRMLGYPAMPPSMADDERPRSICLAEVRWQQELADENAIRYGIGLKYLD